MRTGPRSCRSSRRKLLLRFCISSPYLGSSSLLWCLLLSTVADGLALSPKFRDSRGCASSLLWLEPQFATASLQLRCGSKGHDWLRDYRHWRFGFTAGLFYAGLSFPFLSFLFFSFPFHLVNCVEISDLQTAITLVAMGTSLPSS